MARGDDVGVGTRVDGAVRLTCCSCRGGVSGCTSPLDFPSNPSILSFSRERQETRPLTIKEHDIKHAIPPLQLLDRMLQLPRRMQQLQRRVALAAESQKLVIEDVRDEGVACWGWSGVVEKIMGNSVEVVRGQRKRWSAGKSGGKRGDGKAAMYLQSQTFRSLRTQRCRPN